MTQRQEGLALKWKALIVVVALIGIAEHVGLGMTLCATAGWVIRHWRERRAEIDREVALADLRCIRCEVLAFAIDHEGVFPKSLANLPTTSLGRIKCEHGVPLDPWNRPYLYVAPSEGHAGSIVCRGKDRTDGGSGPAADLEVELGAASK
jgi:hypothetical protein